MERTLLSTMAKGLAACVVVCCLLMLCVFTVMAADRDLGEVDLGIFTADGESFVSKTGSKLEVTSTRWQSKTGTLALTYKSDGTTTQSDYYVVIWYSGFSVGGLTDLSAGSCTFTHGTTEHSVTSTSGSFSFTVKPGDTIKLVLTAQNSLLAGGQTASITIDKIDFTELKEVEVAFGNAEIPAGSVSYTGSFSYNSTTYTQDSFLKAENPTPATIYSNTDISVNAPSTSGNYVFGAWVVDDGTKQMVLSTVANTTLHTEYSGTIYPVYVAANEAMFSVNKVLYRTWDAAFGAAGTNNVMLEKSGTLPNRETPYAMSVGQKLVIPYSADNLAHFGNPSTTTTAGSTRTSFRTLTLEDGAIISCDGGQICVDAQQYGSSQVTGHVAGRFGHIVLNGSSQINLTNGAVLYAYGYISGDGTVTAPSGTSVHELIEMPGWRGGSASTTYVALINSLIFVNYYAQNVLCNLEVNAGANVIVHGAIYADEKMRDFSAPLLAGSTDAGSPLFLISSGGQIVRKYDKSTDRMHYTLVSGKAQTSSMILQLNTTEVDTSKFIFPFDSSLTFTIKKGAEFVISEEIKLLPGTRMIIEEGATCTVSDSLFLYDATEWIGKKFAYRGGATDLALSSLPAGLKGNVTRTLTEADDALLEVNGTLNITASSANVYCSSSGANIYGTGTIIVGGNVATGNYTVIELSADNKRVSVTFYPIKDVLAGLSTSTTDLKAMSAGQTYHGYGTGAGHFWYQHTISVAEQEYADKMVIANGYIGKDATSGDTVIAYICNGGTMNFTIGDYCRCEATNGTLSGAYTLSNVTADSVIALFAHEWNSEWSTDSTSHWHGCQNCAAQNDVGTHSNDGLDCNCDVCTYTMLHHSTNVELGSSLNMYFAFWMDGMSSSDSWKNYYAVLDSAGIRQAVYYNTNVAKHWLWTDANGNDVADPVVYFDGLAAKQMSDTVTVRLYDGGHNLIATWKDSIRDYAMRLLDKHAGEKPQLCTLLVDMLNYGAECQNYFALQNNQNVVADDLANAKLTDEQKALGTNGDVTLTTTPHNPDADSSYFNGANLVTNSGGNFAIALDDNKWESVCVSFTNHWGIQVKDAYAYNKTGETTFCFIPKLVVADARAEIEIVVVYKDSEDKYQTTSWTDSIESYCARMIAQDDPSAAVCKAFMKFSDSAGAYLKAGIQEDIL